MDDCQDPLELNAIVEEFSNLCDDGQRPTIEEFAAKYPLYANEIRDLFPAIVLIDSAASDSRKSTIDADEPSTGIQEEFGDFRIIREIGRGGMGVVYEAQQVSLDRRVALKVIPKHLMEDQDRRERFKREATSAGRLHHTNIIAVFGTGQSHGTDYIVMQLIPGISLETVIRQLRELTEENRLKLFQRSVHLHAKDIIDDTEQDVDAVDQVESIIETRHNYSLTDPVATTSAAVAPAYRLGGLDVDVNKSGRIIRSNEGATNYWRCLARIIKQAADAIHYAHENGVVHRDIKPGNLLLDTGGQTWIADFGLAKLENSEDLTQTGSILGTLRYMSPESLEGEADHRGDIYSLGLTSYELTALRPAFDAKDQKECLRQIINEAPLPLKKTRPEIPRDLQTIIHKAIERDPADRYTVASDLADDLQRFIDDEPIRARRVSSVEHVYRWAKKHRMIASLATTIALLLVAASIASTLVANKFRVVNQVLVATGKDLSTANKKTTEASERNLKLAESAQSNLVGLRIASGLGHVKDNLKSDAIWDFQRAWENDVFDSRPDSDHQTRLGSLLELMPEIAGLAVSDFELIQPAQYLHEKDLLLHAGRRSVELWQASSAKMINRIDLSEDILHAEITRNGELLAITCDSKCQIIRSRDGKHLISLNHPKPVTNFSFSSDGSLIVTTCEDGIVRIWNTNTGERNGDPIVVREGPFFYARFVNDGKSILANLGNDAVKLYSSSTGEPISKALPHEFWMKESACLPILTDDQLVTAANKKIYFWDLKDGSEESQIHVGRRVCDFDISRNGNRILVSENGGTLTTVHELQDSKWKGISERRAPRETQYNALSPNGRYALARYTGSNVIVWDLDSKTEVERMAGFDLLHFFDDQLLVVSFLGGITRVLNLDSFEKRVSGRIESEVVNDSVDRWNGTRSESEMVLQSEKSKRTFRFKNQMGRITTEDGAIVGKSPLFHSDDDKISASFVDHGRRLAAVVDRHYWLWDSKTGEPIGKAIDIGKPDFLSVSDDGRRIGVVYQEDLTQVWDVEFGKMKIIEVSQESSDSPELPAEVTDYRNAQKANISPDGKYVVVARTEERYHDVIVVGTGELKFQTSGHRGWAASVSFSSDSKYFITPNSDMLARVWNAETGEEMGPPLVHPTFVRAAAISRNGQLAATVDGTQELRLWSVRSGEQLGLPVEIDKRTSDPIWFSAGDNSLVWRDSKRKELVRFKIRRIRLDCEGSHALVELITHKIDSPQDPTAILTHDLVRKSKDKYLKAWRKLNAIGNDK